MTACLLGPAFFDTHHTGSNDRQDRLDVACKAVKFSSGDTIIQWCLVINVGTVRKWITDGLDVFALQVLC